MSEYAEYFQRHLRLMLLRYLNESPQYAANSSLLHALAAQFGLPATRDQVKTELAWLAEQRLVRTEEMTGMVVATLTERGVDVAEGRTVVPGVQKPSAKV